VSLLLLFSGDTTLPDNPIVTVWDAFQDDAFEETAQMGGTFQDDGYQRDTFYPRGQMFAFQPERGSPAFENKAFQLDAFVGMGVVFGAGSISTGEGFGSPAIKAGPHGAVGITTGEQFGSTKVRFRIAPRGITEPSDALRLRSLTGAPNKLRASTGAYLRGLAAVSGAAQVKKRLGSTGIASGEAFGNADRVNLRIGETGIVSAEAFGQTTVRKRVGSVGVSTGEAFGNARVGWRIGPAGIGSAEASGQSTIRKRGGSTGIQTGEAFGTATVRLIVSTTGVSSAEAFGQDAVRKRIGTAGISTAEAFGSAVRVQLRVGEAGVPSAEAFGQTNVLKLIGAAGISTGEAFGQPAVSAVAGNAVGAAGGIATGEQSGQQTVVKFIGAAGIASEEAFGAIGPPVVSTAGGVVPVFDLPKRTPLPSVTWGVGGIRSEEAFGTPTLVHEPEAKPFSPLVPAPAYTVRTRPRPASPVAVESVLVPFTIPVPDRAERQAVESTLVPFTAAPVESRIATFHPTLEPAGITSTESVGAPTLAQTDPPHDDEAELELLAMVALAV
jgi:hypothetical protein